MPRGNGNPGLNDSFSRRLSELLDASPKARLRRSTAAGTRLTGAASTTTTQSPSTAGSNGAPTGSTAAGDPGADSFSVRLADLKRSLPDGSGASGDTSAAAAMNHSASAIAADSGTKTEEGASDSFGPVGEGDWMVNQGECISSIARETGHFWETLWNEAANAELREVRQDPNVLLAGDRVTVPEPEPKYEAGTTEMRHRFVRRGEPSILRMRVLKDKEPQGNQPYELVIDGAVSVGQLDANGMLEVPIPGSAQRAELHVGEGERRRTYPIRLGAVDPISEVTGVQRRLKNLGFQCGAVDGVVGPRTRAALRKFQRAYGIPVTGELTDDTRVRLRKEHGS